MRPGRRHDRPEPSPRRRRIDAEFARHRPYPGDRQFSGESTEVVNSAYGAHARTKNHLQQIDAYLLEGQRHAEALKRAGGLAPATSDDDELDPASDDEGDLELSMTPQQRQARLGRLDRIGVDGGNLPAVRAPEAGGGAFLSARVLEDELERLKRFSR